GQRDHRRRGHGAEEPVPRAQLHPRQEQEHRGRVGRGGIGGERLPRLRGQCVHAARDHESTPAQKGQRQGGAHQGLRAGLARVDRLAREGRIGGGGGKGGGGGGRHVP